MKTQKGFLMIAAVFIILLIGFLGFSFTLMLVGSSNAYNNFDYSDKALYLALSGLEVGSHNIALGTSCSAINGGANYTNVSLLGGQFTLTTTTTNVAPTLSAALTATATSIPVSSTTGLTTNGMVYIDNEMIQYSGISGSNLTYAVRGAGGTAASAHASGAIVSENTCTITSVAGIPSIASATGLRTLTGTVTATGLSFELGNTNATPAMVVAGSVSLANTAVIQNASATSTSNNFAGSTIISAGPTVLNNSATTQINSSSGLVTSSSSSGIKGDIVQDSSAINLSNMFGLYFNQPEATVEANANQTYTSSNISGATGKTIWMNSSLNISGTQVIGSPSSPVILIVNGNANIGGTVTIYGFLYVIGSLSTNNTPQIIGAMAVEGAVNLNGSPVVDYNTAILSELNLLNSDSSTGYSSTLFNLAEVF